MFSCKELTQMLLEYLDGEMAPEEEARLRQHLSACPPCLDFLETYKATPSLCRRALASKMPPELSSKLSQFLRSKIKTPDK
jgi:anti-sigma factor (TIGR02949 family)